MNTVGKILVVLNLVFALAAGTFMVVDFAARTNERQRADEWKSRAEVAKKNTQALRVTTSELQKKYEEAKTALDQHLLNAQSREGADKARLKDLEKAMAAEKNRAEEAIANAQKHLQEAKRMQEVVTLANETIERRQQQVVELQKDADKFRTAALQSEQNAKVALERNQNLLKTIQEQQRLIAQLQAGPAVTTVAAIRDPSFQNPPPAYVRGVISKVDDKDKSLVRISIGSDVGVKEDHTLEIYRLQPPAYLGRLRIVETFPHEAIGRLMRVGSMPIPQVQPGDEVASSILNR